MTRVCKTIAAGLAAILVPASSLALTPAEKACIFSAAGKLPAIPGLTIIGSRLSPLPKELKKSSKDDRAVLVEIDVKAAAQEATFAFICGTEPNVPAIAVPAGLLR